MENNNQVKNSNKVALYISSFDGYMDLWNTYFKIIDRYWNDCPYRKYLVTNYESINRQDVIVLKTGKEINWFNRTLKSLKMISEDYIIFTLEDYYLSKEINTNDIEQIIQHMQDCDIFYYQLSLQPSIRKLKHSSNAVKASIKENYPISLQLAIWKRSKFIEILEEIKGESPWDFELYFRRRYVNQKQSNFIQGIRYDTRDLFGYKNGVLRGKWIGSTVDYYRKTGILIDTKTRGVVSKYSIIKWKIAVFISRNTSYKFKKTVKTLLNKLHIKYV